MIIINLLTFYFDRQFRHMVIFTHKAHQISFWNIYNIDLTFLLRPLSRKHPPFISVLMLMSSCDQIHRLS